MRQEIRVFLIRWKAGWSVYRKDYAEAVRHYKEALALDGDDSFELSLVAQYLEHEQKDDEAMEFAQRALKLDPDDYAALKTAARISTKRGQYHEAKDYIVRSLGNLPDLSASRLFHFLGLLAKFVSAVPGVRNRVNRDEIHKVQNPELYTHEWREWACQFLDWYSKEFGTQNGSIVH